MGETIRSQSLRKKRVSSLLTSSSARTVKSRSFFDRTRTSSCVTCNRIWMGFRSWKTISASQLYLLALTMTTGPSLAARWRSGKREGRRIFVSDGRMACREIRRCRILQIALDDPLDCKVESERGLEWLFPIWETVTRKVDQLPLVLAKLFNDPSSARFFSIYTC